MTLRGVHSRKANRMMGSYIASYLVAIAAALLFAVAALTMLTFASREDIIERQARLKHSRTRTVLLEAAGFVLLLTIYLLVTTLLR